MKTINAKVPTVCFVMFVVAIQMSGPPFVSVANSQSTNPDTKTAAVDPAAEINAANQLVRDGKFTDAIDAYSAIEAPETSDQLDYNLAIAHYRNGDFDAAATLFSKVAGAADSLANKSQYNLGNCHYAKSLKRIQPTQQQAQQELKPAVKEAAISDLRSAILAYRGSLRGNPDNADARANIELAVELIKKLEEETPEDEKEDEKEEQEKKDQENQQNEDQKQDEQQDEQQQDEQQQDEQQENKEGQGKDDQKGEPDKEQKQDGDDEKAENKDDNEQEKNDEKNKPGENQDEQKPNQENGKDGKEDDQQQQQNSSNDEPGKEEPGKEQQGKEEQEKEGKKPPAGELTSENQQDQKETDAAEAVAQEGEEKMKLMTNQEALKMLQAVRDRDMLRRFQLQQRERSRRIPVDKDW